MIVDIKKAYYDEELDSDDAWRERSLEKRIEVGRRLESVFEDFLEGPSIVLL
jgi:hypothetical protein